MVVAFDLRPLQTGHQYRGIGVALHNIMTELLKQGTDVKQWEVIYYVYEGAVLPPLLHGELSFGRIVEVPQLHPRHNPFKLIRYLNRIRANISKAQSISRLPELDKVDVFVQFDFWLGLPKKAGIKNVLVKYDIIPLILSNHYLPNYASVKSRQSVKAALKSEYNRRFYMSSLKKCLNRSNLVLAISQQTKNDLINYLGVPETKIKLLYLAADPAPATHDEAGSLKISAINWRLIRGQKRLKPVSVPGKPYLLYIGGADYRRRIEDLITAFNHLRAAGTDCRLLLVGYDFRDIDTVPSSEIKRALAASSYGEDIHLLGFITAQQKHQLYKNALAYVYPTMYEGFGLPILEAMSNQCPVICYDNSSLREVGGKSALYAKNPDDIIKAVQTLLDHPEHRKTIIEHGLKQAETFSWQKTANKLVEAVKAI